jgi:NAD(P)-dependent dehydrogenase (short-subunit alcohol dehydrogenase family)
MRERGFGRIVNISSGTTRRAPAGVGAYASTKAAVNMLSGVLRRELAGDGIAVSLLLPSITATGFGGGMFTLGASPRPGMVVQSPEYVASVVLRLLRTGEESFDIPHGPEQPDLAWVSGSSRLCGSRAELESEARRPGQVREFLRALSLTSPVGRFPDGQTRCRRGLSGVPAAGRRARRRHGG